MATNVSWWCRLRVDENFYCRQCRTWLCFKVIRSYVGNEGRKCRCLHQIVGRCGPYSLLAVNVGFEVDKLDLSYCNENCTCGILSLNLLIDFSSLWYWCNRELYGIVRPRNYRRKQQLPDPAVAMRGCCLRLVKLHEGVLARLIQVFTAVVSK